MPARYRTCFLGALPSRSSLWKTSRQLRLKTRKALLPVGKTMSFRHCGLIACTALFALPAAAFAQAFPTEDPLTVTVSPQYPQPFSTATLTFTSSSVDLANATLSVKEGASTVYTGNAGPVGIALGAPGKPVRLSVTATSDGTPYTQTVTIVPQDVALVAEPQSSAPPLYVGKPLVPQGGSTRVVAAANLRTPAGAPLDPRALSYAWTVDDTELSAASGIGKDALVVASPLEYRASTVSVVVSSQDGAEIGGDSLTLMPEDPLVRVYENDPLRGIRFDRALSGTYAIANSESSLYAAAYSFPTDQGGPSVRWFLGGSLAQTGPLVTLRPTGSGTGSATLSVSAESADGTSASSGLSLTFGTNSSGIFGL